MPEKKKAARNEKDNALPSFNLLILFGPHPQRGSGRIIGWLRCL